jgi:hypothetical protein
MDARAADASVDPAGDGSIQGVPDDGDARIEPTATRPVESERSERAVVLAEGR